MMKRSIPGLLVFSLVSGWTNLLAEEHDHPIGDAVHELPLFDAHIHYKAPAWDEYPVESIMN